MHPRASACLKPVNLANPTEVQPRLLALPAMFNMGNTIDCAVF